MDPRNTEQERWERHMEQNIVQRERSSQCEDLVNYLTEWDHGITSYEAYDQLGITQLTARKSELEKRGYQFRDEWETRHARNGRRIKLKRYWLDEASRSV